VLGARNRRFGVAAVPTGTSTAASGQRPAAATPQALCPAHPLIFSPPRPLVSSAAAAANDDCEVGAAGRKACKNCTCGRAEAGPDAPPAKLSKDMLENPTSGCGSVSGGP
jgi:hypothetical protein